MVCRLASHLGRHAMQIISCTAATRFSPTVTRDYSLSGRAGQAGNPLSDPPPAFV